MLSESMCVYEKEKSKEALVGDNEAPSATSQRLLSSVNVSGMAYWCDMFFPQWYQALAKRRRMRSHGFLAQWKSLSNLLLPIPSLNISAIIA